MDRLEDAQKAILADLPSAKIRLLQIDLSDMTSVRRAADEVNRYQDNIDIMVNNAAIVSLPAFTARLGISYGVLKCVHGPFQMDCPYHVTPEGHELQFASNYLGPWLFTNLILPKILHSTNKTIVMVSSAGHANGDIRWDDPAFRQGYHKKAA